MIVLTVEPVFDFGSLAEGVKNRNVLFFCLLNAFFYGLLNVIYYYLFEYVDRIISIVHRITKNI